MVDPGASGRRAGGPTRARRIDIDGIPIDPITEDVVVDLVSSAAARGEGGLILTVNADILRQLRNRAGRELAARASIAVADGMPLVWAGRVQGDPLPARVAGSDLTWSLTRSAAIDGRSVFLLGAGPGVAAEAAARFHRADPALVVVGTLSPPLGFDVDENAWAEVVDAVVSAEPDVVLVALGFPRQEQVSLRLLEHLPGSWFLGCGGSLDMVAGRTPRAPEVWQRLGIEWLHRLLLEPRRLFRRYLVDDAPYAAALLLRALGRRLRRRSASTRRGAQLRGGADERHSDGRHRR